MNEGMGWIRTGAVLAGLAVVTGAFAAHGLDGFLRSKYAGMTKMVSGQEVPAAQKYLADFKTGAEYQMYHALGLILLGIAASRLARGGVAVAGWSLVGGVLLFSGSLYALVLSGNTKLGMITPIGGMLFIVGWGAFALSAVSGRGSDAA